MKTKQSPPVLNHLYSLRRNRGYLQKHLAALLGRRVAQRVSAYECGRSLPPLEIALMLEIALGAKLSEIYVDLYQELQLRVLTNAGALPATMRTQLRSRLLGREST
jgi:DNA-binding XRE family transcriptional regulator